MAAIRAAGLRPYLSIGGHAPRWATHGRGRPGTARPDAKEFRLFAQAAGAHFPDVDIWSIWNEPNLYSWLSPQRRKGTPLSPSIYRGLYLDGHRGLSDSGHGGDTILLGELMPRGGTSPAQGAPARVPARDGLPRPPLPPDPRRPRHAGAAAAGSAAFPTSGIAYHPYTLPAGPHSREGRDDAAIGQLDRCARRSTRWRAAASCRAACRSGSPSSATRRSRPTRFGAPLARAAVLHGRERVDRVPQPARGELLAVHAARRPAAARARRRCAGRPGRPACASATARRKRYVYDAFRLPVFVRKLGANRVEVFGGRSTSGGTVQVEANAPRAAATVPSARPPSTGRAISGEFSSVKSAARRNTGSR